MFKLSTTRFTSFAIRMMLCTKSVTKNFARRVNEKERMFTKCLKYSLLSHKANFGLNGKSALRLLFMYLTRLTSWKSLWQALG